MRDQALETIGGVVTDYTNETEWPRARLLDALCATARCEEGGLGTMGDVRHVRAEIERRFKLKADEARTFKDHLRSAMICTVCRFSWFPDASAQDCLRCKLGATRLALMEAKKGFHR